MGLLSRAEKAAAWESDVKNSDNVDDITGQTAVEEEQSYSLDDMGKALGERIKRLPLRKSTPYTALSLLKAYSAFQSGVCLVLKDGLYTSFTSVSFGIEKISIPQEKIWSEENSGASYFKLDPEKTTEIKNTTEGLEYWVFPLGSPSGCGEPNSPSAQPWEGIMILGVPNSAEINSTFDPQAIAAIIPEIVDKILIRDEPALAEEKDAAEVETLEVQPLDVQPLEVQTAAGQGGEDQTVEDRIVLFYQIYSDMNYIILEIPDSADEDGVQLFFKKVSDMVGMAGTTILLLSGRPLILLPKALDRELIAHRISKSLNTTPVVSSSANDPRIIIDHIKSLA